MKDNTVRLILATGEFLEYGFAECDFYTEGCDSAIDYTLYDGNYEEKDGGQMDYSSEKTHYTDLLDAISDIIMFALSISRENIPQYYII